MISINNILITEKVRKILGSKNIKLSEINFSILRDTLRNENIIIKIYTLKDWNKFRKSKEYETFLTDIDELYQLGYGNKFISLCLSIKYKVFISFQIIHRVIRKNKKDRLSYAINNEVFKESDIILKGRIIYNKGPDSNYLTFKCIKLFNLSQKQRIGIKVFYNKRLTKVYLERDDRSSKKINVHRSNDMFISLYPVPQKLRDYLTKTKTSYKSFSVEIHFNSKNFGFTREELIDDIMARKLYPELKKYGFSLAKERTTSMSRSKGDLVVYKNNNKLVIELTDVGKKVSAKNPYIRDGHTRDLLIGKIMRILICNNCMTLFVLNINLKKSVINEDFKKIIEKYKIIIIFTDFENKWQIDVAKKISDSFKFK